MAIIIPPEFYGFFGLGQNLQGLGQTLERNQLQERQEGRQDEQDALIRLQTLMQLYPNNPEVWIEQATGMGLVAPGTGRTPTSSENVERIRTSAAGKIAAGTPFNALEPFEQLAYGAQFGLAPGQTPAEATEVVDLEVERRRLEVDAAKRAEEYASSYDSFIANPEVQERYKLPKGANKGTIEALGNLSQLTSESLRNDLTRAQVETERQQLKNMQAQLKRWETEAKRIAAESPEAQAGAQWLLDLAKVTGYSPLALRAAFDPSSALTEEGRGIILKQVQNYRNAIMGDFQKRIREGQGGDAVEALTNMKDLMEMGVDFGMTLDDPFFQQLKEQALLEMGIPAHFVQAPPSFWSNDPVIELVPGERPAGAPVPTAAEQAADLVGDGELPIITQEEASLIAASMISKHGSVEKALEVVNSTEGSEADKKVIRQALHEAQQTITPETPTVKASGVGSVQPETPPELLDPKKRTTLVSQALEAAKEHDPRHYRRFGSSAPIYILDVKLKARNNQLEKLQTELRDITDKEILADSELSRQRWRERSNDVQEEVNDLLEKIRELQLQMDTELRKQGIIP